MRWLSVFTLLLTVLAPPAWADAPAQGWLLDPPTADERFARLQTYLGGFSASMRETGYRYGGVHDALERDNLPLARYHWRKIRNAIEQGILKRPARAANARAILLDRTWGEVDAAFASGDMAQAWAGLAQARGACMACHIAEKVDFMNRQPLFERPLQDPARVCQAQGGRWQAVGRARSWVCDRPYADAGQRCRDSSECEGFCLSQERQRGKAVSGQCSASPAAVFGCYARVENGRAMGRLCVD